MSGNQSASKRPMDSAHDERPSKRSQSDGLTAVSPFNIKDGVKVEALADVWRAVPIMTEQRYIRDLAFLWDQTEIGDATIEEMHEQWFQCRKHGIVEQMWASRKELKSLAMKPTDKRQSFRTIATLSEISSGVSQPQQADLRRELSGLQIDYIMFMVLLCHQKGAMSEVEHHFPDYKKTFADLAEFLRSSVPQVSEALEASEPIPSKLVPSNAVLRNPVPSNPAPSHSAPESDSPKDIRKLVEQMRVSPRSKEDLSLIVGCEEAKKLIGGRARQYAIDPETASDPVLSGGTLLHGIPGTGKSTVVQAAAASCPSIALYQVQNNLLLGQYVGNSEKHASALFEIAKENSPAIIFIDEIDGLFGTNVKSTLASTIQLGKHFLALMTEYEDSGVTVVGATNNPWAIGQPFLCRFQSFCHVPRPSPEQVVAILRLKIRTFIKCHSLQENDIEELGRQMVGFTGREIEHAVSKAWRECYYRLQAKDYSHYHEFPFEGQNIPVACLSGDVGAVDLKEAPSNLVLKAGPCTFENLRDATEDTRRITEQWDEEEERHIAWAKEPRGATADQS